ncbi:GSCOCG00008361001-RA-CDS, partial [Cotesia congregata]
AHTILHYTCTRNSECSVELAGRSMLSNTCSGTPRRQSAMSSSSLVIEQLSCSPTFRLRLLGSCTEAQGLRAEPLNSITLCSK